MVERNKCMSIPKIRFNGTKQNWEKAELSVYAKQYFVSNKNIHHHNLLSLSYGQIIRKDIKSKKGLLPSSYDTYQIVCKGIIVFRFTDLQNDRNSLRVGLVKEEGIITPAYICVIFKDYTGKTVNKYITEYRIIQAKELLKDSNIKMNDIALKVGYKDGNYFAKIFKKETGYTPSEYRRKFL